MKYTYRYILFSTHFYKTDLGFKMNQEHFSNLHFYLFQATNKDGSSLSNFFGQHTYLPICTHICGRSRLFRTDQRGCNVGCCTWLIYPSRVGDTVTSFCYAIDRSIVGRNSHRLLENTGLAAKAKVNILIENQI